MSVEARPEDERIDMGALLGAVLSRWLRILIVTIVALGVTFVILLFFPKMYESTASLLVEERSDSTAAAGSQAASSTPTIPVEAMMSSQIELIRSRDTLLGVIDSENLRSEPEFTGVDSSPLSLVMQLIGRAPEAGSIDERVLDNLRQRLRIARERDSAVISISVLSEDPELAARIANALARAHVQRRAALSLSDTAETSAWLEQEIARLRVKVTEAEAAVANYRVDNDLFTGTDNTSILDQQLSAITAQITAAQERKNAAQSRANLIRQLLSEGQPPDGVQDVRDSVVIQELSQTKATLQGELAQRSSTLLSNHPTIKALVAQIDEIEDQIAAESRRVANALEAEARIEGDLEASLRDDLARTKLSVSSATRDGVTLDGLQREAKAQRDLLESYLLRYSDASSRTDAGSALPDVRQITFAAPSNDPASPKTGLILGAVAFVALALQIGGVMFGALMSSSPSADRNAFRAVPRDESEEEDEAEEPAAVGDLFDNDDHPVAEEAEAGPVPGSGSEDADDQTRRLVDTVAESKIGKDQEYAPAMPAAAASSERGPEAGEEPAPSRRPRPGAVLVPAAGRSDGPAEDAALELGNLAADIAIGRVRVVMLAGLAENRPSEQVADTLIDEAMRSGLSVVRIDAGSGRVTAEPGITDLSTEDASFGDVVHRVREGLAEVPWGQQPALERRSMKPLTLIEALTDIYEVVIVLTGRIGMTSALPVFSGIPCRLVLVGENGLDRRTVEGAVEDAANLGFEIGQIVYPQQRRFEVA